MMTHTVMTIVDQVRTRRQTLIDAWAAALAGTCQPPFDDERLRTDLASLFDRITATLRTGKLDSEEGRAVGRDLAQVACSRPEILGKTHLFLSRHLLAQLEPAEEELLRPLLSTFLGHMALGFSAAVQRAALAMSDLVEEGRRVERRFYTTVLDMVDALVAVIDAQGRLVGFNGACERVSGYRFDEVFGRHYTFMLAPEYRESARAVLSRLEGLSPQKREFIPYRSEWLTRDGERRHIEWSTTAIFDEYDMLRYVIGTGTDVTDKHKMEKELARAHRKVAQAQEVERIRLAQDLHDGAVQQLLGLSYQLAEMQRRATERGPWTPEQQLEELIPALEMVRSEVVAVAHDLRRLISFLRPPALRELGLAQILDAYIEDWRLRIGRDAPEVALDLATLDGKQLPEPVAICIFRLVQEALWNAHKHADAARISVSVDCDEDEIMLRVRDDGRGFRIPPHLFQFASSGRFGFIGMQERVHGLDGLFSVWSEPGRGTEVQAHIPLRNREAHHERSNTGTLSR